MVSDITTFKPDRTFDVWHDRAAFHFLTEAEQISKYVALASSCVKGICLLEHFPNKEVQF